MHCLLQQTATQQKTVQKARKIQGDVCLVVKVNRFATVVGFATFFSLKADSVYLVLVM